MPFCVNCGSEVGAQARVCPVCSYPVEQKPAEQVPAEQLPAEQVAGAPSPPTEAPPTPAAAGPHTDGQAIAAMVCGIAGIPLACGCWFISWIVAIVAIVLGFTSQRRIQQSGGTLGGLGMAKAGWIMGIVGLLLAITFVILLIVFETQPPVDFGDFQVN